MAGWVLDLYAGNPPGSLSGACTGQQPLALQVGGIVCLGATLVGFLAVAAALWHQLHARRRWTRPAGGELSGEAGDWRVFDDRGDERTIRDAAFRASHEPLGGERWRRTGTYRAWQVTDERVLRTLEGRAVAQPGDWVVQGRGGERWPVSDAQFRRTYRAVANE